MTGKRILMVVIPLICIIGEVKADYNYDPFRRESLNGYSETLFSKETSNIRKSQGKNENVPFFFDSENTFSDFQLDKDIHPFIGGHGINSDSSEEDIREYSGEGNEGGGSLEGNPMGLGVGELPLSDGLSILLSLTCLYILWMFLVRHFRRFNFG